MTHGNGAAQLSLSARQADIYRRLLRLVGAGAAEFWKEACDRMAESPVRPVTTHMVGHALREVDSALRAVLEERAMAQVGPAQIRAARKAKESGSLEISAICADLQIPESHPLREFWLGQSPEVPIGLHKRAHRNGLEYPRPMDAGFREFFSQMEALFDLVLERFELRYSTVFDSLDLLLAEQNPVAEHAKRLAQKFPANETARRYFFNRASTAWLGALREHGFFINPPPAILEPGNESAVLRRWPESEYLVRVAADDPQATIEAALDIPATDNSYVIWDVVKIALTLPPAHGVGLVPTIVASIPGPFGVIAADEIGELAVRLAEAEYAEAADDLIRGVLKDVPKRGQEAVRVYDYVSVVRTPLPAVASVVGLPMLTFAVGLLDAAVETFKADGEDNSRFWRPSLLADEDDTYGPDARDALVDAVRSIAEILLSSGQATLQQALDVLEQHHALIFRRIALHLVRENGRDDPGLVRRYLFDRDLLADRGAEYEFQLFLRDVHALLEPHEVQQLVDAILAGPDTAPWKNRFSEAHDHPDPDATVRQLAGMWIRDRLAPLEPVLDSAARDRYQQLVTQCGPASDLSVVPVRFASSWTEESPVDAGELQALPAAELVEFLARWQPPQDWRGLDRSAICNALSASIAAAAEQRSHDAGAFTGVDPAHASAILEGFTDAARDRRELDWAALIEFFRWVDDQAAAELAAMVTTRAVRQWRRARYNVLHILGTALRHTDSPIPAGCEPGIWAIVRSAIADPDPQDEADPASSALDAVRPAALHTAIQLGLWKRRADSQPPAELLALIEQHLSGPDGSAAVPETLGRNLPVLHFIDPSWTREHLDQILPEDSSLNDTWTAAWDGFLDNPAPSDQLWDLLLPHYERAVRELSPDGDDDWAVMRASQLASHLGRRYWFGYIGLDDPDQLLHRFYQQAPAQAAAVIVEMSGNSLAAAVPLDPAHRDRLMKLWEYRLATANPSSRHRELQTFDDWYLSGAFDEDWSLAQLRNIMVSDPEIHPSFRALQRMSSNATQHAPACLHIFETWLDNGPKYWDYARRIDDVKAILRGAAAAGAAERVRVEHIVSRFSALGTDLRDVLTQDSFRENGAG
ncbi:hypothetical protein [Micromonospora parva]|uniref:Uncharacterized protein n=1 Tax=Micromonospora parva TaxID=1464048 RepID=A0ABW6VMX6_9ACTN|nr:hypothetical protein [Micromonospora parva]